MSPVDELKGLIADAENIVAFTGAGISTESGIPDFRSPGGIWTKFKPIDFGDFLRSEVARRETWRRKFATHPTMQKATPNAGHRALARLAPGMAKLKLSGFREQWQAEQVSRTESSWVVQIRTKSSLLQRCLGKAPGRLKKVFHSRPSARRRPASSWAVPGRRWPPGIGSPWPCRAVPRRGGVLRREGAGRSGVRCVVRPSLRLGAALAHQPRRSGERRRVRAGPR